MRKTSATSPDRRQRGLSAMGMLVLLIVVVGGITLTLKLLPHYIDYYTINSVIEGLPAQDVRTMSRTSLSEMLEKRFRINNLRGFSIRDMIDLDRGRDGTVLHLKYEQRQHLFFNVDVVLSFEKDYEY